MSRIKLTGGVFNVHTNFDTGSDVNPGTFPLPYKTVNGALYDVYDKYDFQGTAGNQTQLVVNMAPNVTDTEGVHFSAHGGMVGAQGGHAVTIQSGGNSAICPAKAAALDIYFGGVICINGVRLGNGIGAHDGAKIYLNGCDFIDSSYCMMLAEHHSHIQIDGNCALWGNAPYIVLAANGSSIETMAGAAVYFGQNINFTTFALATHCSKVSVAANLNSYSATGKRYQVDANAVIEGANDQNFYPGSINGSKSSGGQYI